MSEYYELLKHPKWQKKRLEVLERENFTCEYCGTKEKELHVHHTYYEKGRKPWEYEDVFLKCLCKKCHEYVRNVEDRLKFVIGFIGSDQMEQIIGYIKAVLTDTETGNEQFMKMAEKSYPETVIIESIEESMGFGDYYSIKKFKEITDIMIKNGGIHINEIMKIIFGE